LANEAFVSRAPADIIEKERQALTDLATQLAEVKEAINKLRTL
jgi:valyl-tRNA synthetase